MKVLSKVDEIGFVKLTNHDVVRHPLVQKIVKHTRSMKKGRTGGQTELKEKEK